MTNLQTLFTLYMKEYSISAQQLAEDIGISATTFRELLNGKPPHWRSKEPIDIWLLSEHYYEGARPHDELKTPKLEQKPITHNVAPQGAHPPMDRVERQHHGYDLDAGSREADALKIHEGNN